MANFGLVRYYLILKVLSEAGFNIRTMVQEILNFVEVRMAKL